MKQERARLALCAALAGAALAGQASHVRADAILDWNVRSGEILLASKIGTPPAVRVMAVVQTAAYDAVNAITRRYPAADGQPEAVGTESAAAAVAAAHRVTLMK